MVFTLFNTFIHNKFNRRFSIGNGRYKPKRLYAQTMFKKNKKANKEKI